MAGDQGLGLLQTVSLSAQPLLAEITHSSERGHGPLPTLDSDDHNIPPSSNLQSTAGEYYWDWTPTLHAPLCTQLYGHENPIIAW